MNTESLTDLPLNLSSVHRAYKNGLTPHSLLAEVLRRIDEADDSGIFIDLLDQEDILGQADLLPAFDLQACPLWGIPYAVKDNIDVAGRSTTAGCPDYAYEASADASVVARLRAAGAILIGKTNLDQFATGLVGLRSPYAPPHNAIDPEIPPGGSSSGSAVAVARGLVSLALGTDTAGSGRVPAALNNIVGLKPSLGLLSASGVVPACRTLDTISIFAFSVGDAHTALKVCSGFDDADPYSRQGHVDELSAPGRKLRIGIPDQATLECYGDEIQREAFSLALGQTGPIEIEIVPVDFTPFYQVANMLYDGAWVAERYSVIESMLASSPESVHPVTRAIVGKAVNFSATDAFRDQYKLKALRRICENNMADLDALCVPTIPTFFTLADLQADPIGPNNKFGRYTNFVNLLDMCGIAVPVAPRRDGRPGSVTILARHGQDSLAAVLGQAMQQAAASCLGATEWPLPAEAPLAPQANHDEIAVAVVGAHLSGMPLNKELTSRGARLLQATHSANSYRLYALAGDKPARPALVKDASGGANIELEIWAIPHDGFAGFMAGIPQPLGIGTIELADGSTCKGFICEPAGLEGATEVTSFGGWRHYIASQNKAPQEACPSH